MKTDIDSNWTNPQYVGVAGKATYQGKSVVLASATLGAFKAFMNKKQMPQAYDHAIGFFKYKFYFVIY